MRLICEYVCKSVCLYPLYIEKQKWNAKIERNKKRKRPSDVLNITEKKKQNKQLFKRQQLQFRCALASFFNICLEVNFIHQLILIFEYYSLVIPQCAEEKISKYTIIDIKILVRICLRESYGNQIRRPTDPFG